MAGTRRKRSGVVSMVSAPVSPSGRDAVVISARRSSIEWLGRMARAEHDEADPVAEYVDFATRPESWTDGADEAIAAVRKICRDVCPDQHRCVGDRCNYYRVEQAALAAKEFAIDDEDDDDY